MNLPTLLLILAVAAFFFFAVGEYKETKPIYGPHSHLTLRNYQ